MATHESSRDATAAAVAEPTDLDHHTEDGVIGAGAVSDSGDEEDSEVEDKYDFSSNVWQS
jgi:hypothetical protein